MKKILFALILLLFCNCEFPNERAERVRRSRAEKAINLKKKDSLFQLELVEAKIPYPELGIDKNSDHYKDLDGDLQDYLITDRKIYLHDSKRSIYKVVKVEDYYQFRKRQMDSEMIKYKNYFNKQEALDRIEKEILEARISLNTNTYCIWRLKKKINK